ncbi:MAG: ABC transporter ATP-binding protein, partial [Burkholderiales bacterium]|nr:ABC transporter ATP-binding protein [Burkholderiales bacterium]
MSSDLAIKVEGLSKCFHIYDRPRDRLLQMFAGKRKKYYREFWALKDLNFEIKKGETIGIVGRNGSGKSTLLQMICGTLNPTQGDIQTRGRIAALLELGAGFNPEFTGRENVYMNASILGLSKEQIDARFADIAAFADIGDFIEQPVKNYSSGMYVRLAFAVIAHVDADILVVDEALAVGDAVFTQKCMRFIRNFQKNGTLLFVSHDMGSVLNLCEKAIWLHKGEVRQMGASQNIAEQYLQYTLQETYGSDAELHAINQISTEDATKSQISKQIEIWGNALDYGAEFEVSDNLTQANGWKTGKGEITSVNLEKIDKDNSDCIFKGWDKARITIQAKIHEDMLHPIIGFNVRDKLGQVLFGENTLPFTSHHPTPV